MYMGNGLITSGLTECKINKLILRLIVLPKKLVFTIFGMFV